jgi:hypothetical protein
MRDRGGGVGSGQRRFQAAEDGLCELAEVVATPNGAEMPTYLWTSSEPINTKRTSTP